MCIRKKEKKRGIPGEIYSRVYCICVLERERKSEGDFCRNF